MDHLEWEVVAAVVCMELFFAALIGLNLWLIVKAMRDDAFLHRTVESNDRFMPLRKLFGQDKTVALLKFGCLPMGALTSVIAAVGVLLLLVHF